MLSLVFVAPLPFSSPLFVELNDACTYLTRSRYGTICDGMERYESAPHCTAIAVVKGKPLHTLVISRYIVILYMLLAYFRRKRQEENHLHWDYTRVPPVHHLRCIKANTRNQKKKKKSQRVIRLEWKLHFTT